MKNLQVRQLNFSDTTRIQVPGIPSALPAFRIPPGARAFARTIPSNTGAVYVAKHNRPRVSVGLSSGGAFALRSTDEMPMELDCDVLSQWFVDADVAGDGVQVWVEWNLEGRAQ